MIVTNGIVPIRALLEANRQRDAYTVPAEDMRGVRVTEIDVGTIAQWAWGA